MVATEPESEQRFNEVIAEYMEATECGQHVDRGVLASRFPDLAKQLREAFGVFDRFAGLRPPPVIPPSGEYALGDYTLLEIIGRGAMGVVYKARQKSLRRTVAVKICRVQSPREQQRFFAEAQSAAGLHHPNIVQVHEVNSDGGHHFIAMTYLEGQTLAALIAENPLPPETAAEYVRTVAAAIEYAHQQGIVHRDIKPGNIVLDAAGQPHVTDFGLAKAIGGDGTMTETGEVLGTPAYMSPEQATAGDFGAASDIYSLGALLYALLTGRPPFQAHSPVATLKQIAEQEPPLPSRINSVVPRDLETICLKCLQKEPARRYLSAGALADDLSRFLHGDPIAARRTSAIARGLRWCRRNPWLVTMTAALVMTLVLASGGAVTWMLRERDAQVRAVLEARTRAEIQLRSLLNLAQTRLQTPTAGRRRDAQEILYQTAVPRRLLVENDITRRLDLETRSIYAATLAVPELCIERSPALPGRTTVAWPVAMHPDGRSVAIGTSGRPMVWRVGDKSLPATVQADAGCLSIDYSPSGRQILVARDMGGLESWTNDGKTQVGEWRSDAQVLALGPMGDNTSLWACCSDGGVRMLSLPSLQLQREWSLDKNFAAGITAARFSLDAELLSIGDATGEVRFYRVKEERLLHRIAADRNPVEALAWSPDKELVAIGIRGGAVQVRHWMDGTLSHLLLVSSAGVGNVEFSPKGDYLLAGYRDEMKVWDAVSGEQLLTADMTPCGFANDGVHFAVTSLTHVGLCELKRPWVIHSFPGHRSSVDRLAWSADNRHLATLDSRFECRVWDAKEARAVDTFQAPPSDGYYAHNSGLAISADGSQLGYVSGGAEQSQVVVRDIEARNNLASWTLSGGFEQLGYADDRFLLVREEDRKQGDRVTQTVVWEFSAGQPPRRLRVLRNAQPADGVLFFSHMLTPDAKYYLWIGPRHPQIQRDGTRIYPNKRFEVREVATGRLMLSHVVEESISEPAGMVAPDGRHVWTWARTPEGPQVQRFDLRDGTSTAVHLLPLAACKDGQMAVHQMADDIVPNSSVVLRRNHGSPGWLRLVAPDVTNLAFSPNGRYLAWANGSGTVSVMDLRTVLDELRSFERELARH